MCVCVCVCVLDSGNLDANNVIIITYLYGVHIVAVSDPSVLIIDQQGGNTLLTRTGCMVALECSGMGDAISWRKFGNRTSLISTDSITVTVCGLTLGQRMNVELFLGQ